MQKRTRFAELCDLHYRIVLNARLHRAGWLSGEVVLFPMSNQAQPRHELDSSGTPRFHVGDRRLGASDGERWTERNV